MKEIAEIGIRYWQAVYTGNPLKVIVSISGDSWFELAAGGAFVSGYEYKLVTPEKLDLLLEHLNEEVEVEANPTGFHFTDMKDLTQSLQDIFWASSTIEVRKKGKGAYRDNEVWLCEVAKDTYTPLAYNGGFGDNVKPLYKIGELKDGHTT